MIKINLLKDPFAQRSRTTTKNSGDEFVENHSEAKPTNKKSQLLAGLLLFLIFGSLGGLYYLWLDRYLIKEKNRNMDLSAQKEELEPYFKLEQQFREQNESLREKEEVLTKLKKQQQLPVYFLLELANSIPDNIWLVRINNKANRVEIRGESLSEDAIYKFRDNLASKPQRFTNVNFPGAIRRSEKLEFAITFDLMNPV